MIKLIKQYPFISVMIAVMGIGFAMMFLYNRWQDSQIHVTRLEHNIYRDESEGTDAEHIEYSSTDKKDEKVQQDMLQSSEGTLVENSPAVVSEMPQPAMPTRVPVYICGEVNAPGVYYISSDAIINEVVKLSGGFTEMADVKAVNLASPIIPNEKIIIPKVGEQIDKLVESYDNIEGNERLQDSSAYESSHKSEIKPHVDQQENSMVNINTADQKTLMTLPGVGEVKAAAIIAYRQEHGLFSSKEEIKNVSGIGDKTYEKLAALITT